MMEPQNALILSCIKRKGVRDILVLVFLCAANFDVFCFAAFDEVRMVCHARSVEYTSVCSENYFKVCLAVFKELVIRDDLVLSQGVNPRSYKLLNTGPQNGQNGPTTNVFSEEGLLCACVCVRVCV